MKRTKKFNILYTTPVLEYPFAGGPALRVGNSIKALNAVSNLHVVSRVKQKKLGGKEGEMFFKTISNRFSYSPSGREQKYRDTLSKISLRFKNFQKYLNLNSINKSVTPNYHQKDVAYLIKYVEQHNIDIIWFGFGNISYEIMRDLKTNLPHVKMVCDTDSVWSRFILRELDSLADSNRKDSILKLGKKKESEEKSWVDFMDVTTAVSEIDEQYYISICSTPSNIKIFSNVIDLSSYPASATEPENFNKPCIYLAGTFWKNSPMQYAANWLINDILPLVKKEIPNIHLYIVGKGSREILSNINDSSITITGMLPSILPYLLNATVVVVPLSFESGTRFKILEAGACNKPIVSTTLGAEGIPVIDKEHILLADSTNDFATAIIELINNKDLADTISQNCYSLVSSKYSISNLEREALSIINHLLPTP